jgi:hypothetical protein
LAGEGGAMESDPGQEGVGSAVRPPPIDPHLVIKKLILLEWLVKTIGCILPHFLPNNRN